MAIAVFLHWDGVTTDEYDKLRELVNWEGEPPVGGNLHVAAFDESGMHAIDLWETAEDFQEFVANRLTPGVQQLGMSGAPAITMFPVHAIFAPGV